MQTTIGIVTLLVMIVGFIFFRLFYKKKKKEIITIYTAVVSKDGEEESLETRNKKLINNWIKRKEEDGYVLVNYEQVDLEN